MKNCIAIDLFRSGVYEGLFPPLNGDYIQLHLSESSNERLKGKDTLGTFLLSISVLLLALQASHEEHLYCNTGPPVSVKRDSIERSTF